MPTCSCDFYPPPSRPFIEFDARFPIDFDAQFDGAAHDATGSRDLAVDDGARSDAGFIEVCDSGFVGCGPSCIDLLNDPDNCGACGHVCLHGYNQVPRCSMAVCGTPDCLPYSGDCDGNSANGCETVLTTPTNCGGCRVVCSAPTPVCTPSSGVTGGGVTDGAVADAGTPTYSCAAICLEAGTTGCGEMCVDLQIDPANCGGCGVTCAAGEVCRMSVCVSPEVVDGGVADASSSDLE